MKLIIVVVLCHLFLVTVDNAQGATVKRECREVVVRNKLFLKCRIVEVKDHTVVCTHYPFTDHMKHVTKETYCTYFDKRVHQA